MMATSTDTPGEIPGGADATEAATGERRLERFSSVQVYVHGTIALCIFVLYLTGLPMTFADHLGWLFAIFGYGNVVLLHVVAGVVFITVATYYLLYVLLTGLFGPGRIAALPTRRDVSEAIGYVKYLLGRGEKPAADKYTWLQKGEIWVLGVELLVLSVTGLLLWYRGLFVSPEFRAALGGHEQLADVLLLIVRDIHVVVALTMLMGIAFHLYMVNVKERFPFNRTMFTGDVSASRAKHHWADWADEQLEGDADAGHDETPVPSRRTLAVITLALLAFFAVVLLSTLFAAVLSPLPTREYLLALPFDPVTHGAASVVFFVGLNVAVLLIVAGALAICYGLAKRLRGEF
ncbi:Cytochrome c family protein precursor [Natrarchaeobaculum sulfurireducens]|uniref:Cytochrome c family protein n=2 Tax=Natrarchaeobaculum sulfurireducens TaxID=2044521 RepID=A0A346PRS6_9EURY|nr:Cytochrome c family protein precursor [Natrarchaeobaculum sulfurireducens]